MVETKSSRTIVASLVLTKKPDGEHQLSVMSSRHILFTVKGWKLCLMLVNSSMLAKRLDTLLFSLTNLCYTTAFVDAKSYTLYRLLGSENRTLTLKLRHFAKQYATGVKVRIKNVPAKQRKKIWCENIRTFFRYSDFCIEAFFLNHRVRCRMQLLLLTEKTEKTSAVIGVVR